MYTLAAGSGRHSRTVAFVLSFVRKVGYDHKLVLRLKDDRLIEMALIVLPVVIGTAVNDINVLADRTCSTIVAGGILPKLCESGNRFCKRSCRLLCYNGSIPYDFQDGRRRQYGKF